MKGLVSTEIPFCSSHNIDYVVIGQSFLLEHFPKKTNDISDFEDVYFII